MGLCGPYCAILKKIMLRRPDCAVLLSRMMVNGLNNNCTVPRIDQMISMKINQELEEITQPRPKEQSSLILDLTIPNFKLISPNSVKNHWTLANHRKKLRTRFCQELIKLGKKGQLYNLPCLVKLTKVAPREFDYDNFVSSCKGLIDLVCSYIIPGKQPGRADGTGQIKIEYEQKKGKSKEYYIQIQIWEYS